MWKRKKKSKTKPLRPVNHKSASTAELISKTELDSLNIVRLKVTVRKGARIESIPLKKLMMVSNKKNLYWKLEGEWLILYGLN